MPIIFFNVSPSMGFFGFLIAITLMPLIAQCGLMKPDDILVNLTDFDFVIVGLGSAGSVVAKRLSENPDWKVLVLEASNDGFFYAESTGRTSLAYKNGASRWSRASFGAHNPMYYYRGVPRDYDSWQYPFNFDWSWDDVSSYFEKSVRTDKSPLPPGYVSLSEAEPDHGPFFNIKETFLRAAKELRIPKVNRFEKDYQIGYNKLPTTTFKADLKRPNLQVIRNAEVTSINFDRFDRHVESVRFVYRNQREITVGLKKELVLSAGTIGSAKLLMLSGVGKREHLRQLGIPVVRNLPVGQNLQDHLVVPLFLHTPYEDAARSWPQMRMYEDHRSQPFGNQGGLVWTAFLDTLGDYQSSTPDIELHHFYIKRWDTITLSEWSDKFGLSKKYENSLQNSLDHANLIIINVALAHPQSFGEMRLRSENYTDSPRISPNYLENQMDVKTLLRGIKYVMRLTQTKKFEYDRVQFFENRIDECEKFIFKTDEYWLCYIRYFTGSQYDFVGTVKMGSSSYDSCVDARLRVHNVDNLRVADASVMPKIPTGDVNGATIMIAERASDFIKANWIPKIKGLRNSLSESSLESEF